MVRNMEFFYFLSTKSSRFSHVKTSDECNRFGVKIGKIYVNCDCKF